MVWGDYLSQVGGWGTILYINIVEKGMSFFPSFQDHLIGHMVALLSNSTTTVLDKLDNVNNPS